ncbi:daunorubicin resistance protein DrrA family ABC transporter ATP-binding protein [Tersicoccus solisilvae]|uniref:Daunorubicin resistance protein DrrA family ABC transporter ATP-binding protein n=1 Tax=Tersicoccus solisilvae TaxID=1882339 RepID=A0ABQ1NJR4_9MICC|nr:ATP-binding cassette domain-containing protein [Tersicoccus solisilvae]GGC78533.1 daunorubicin resistance protein DrrA family ABC transporter ATP-binding protein [Tersicoccus solisilvae]
MATIQTRGITKTYASRSGPVHALTGVDLTVEAGTVRGLLGPNGAGKTTVVKVLTTLIQADAGSASINDIDVRRHPQRIRSIIGVSGQYSAVDENLTGLENLEMVGRLYHLGRKRARARAKELIDVFGLAEAGDRPVKGFSGGMRRRIDLAGALVINPQVLFLDEPTTGLDPRSRLGLWDVIRDLVGGGTTVLLTTQYLEEADQLADEISVIDAGRVIAEGTADELKAQVGGHRVAATLVDPADMAAVRDIMLRHGEGEPRVDGSGRQVDVAVEHGPVALQRVLADLDAAGVRVHDAGIRRPTLDDVFLQLTGHMAEESDADDEQAGARRKRGRRDDHEDGGAPDGDTADTGSPGGAIAGATTGIAGPAPDGADAHPETGGVMTDDPPDGERPRERARHRAGAER